MSMNPISPKLRKLAWGAGIILALVLAAHFLLPYVVNTSALRARILSQVAQRVGGEVDFQVLQPALLPLPHAVVIQGWIHRPNMFIIRFAKGVVYPQFWPLLRGRLKIGSLMIIDPNFVIQEAPEYFQSSEQSKDQSLALMGRGAMRC